MPSRGRTAAHLGTSTATSLLRRTRVLRLATSAMAPLLRVAMANVRIVLDDHAW
jgi:hypothetical protein